MRHRFAVIEYASFYAVRDRTTGKEAHMGDGVDTLSGRNGRPLQCGTESFRRKWQRELNRNPDETAEAYFPETVRNAVRR